MKMRGLSPRAQKLVYAFAQDEGRKSGCEQLFPEHVMLALLKNADGLGYFLIKSLRTDVLALQLNLEKVFIAREPLGYSGEIPPSRRLKAMFDLAGIEARILKNDYIGTEHFVLASIREDNSITARYFESIGVNIEDARRVVLEIQAHTPSSVIEQSQRNASKAVFQNFVNNQNQQGSAQNKKNQKSFLQEFSRDLTFFAREGKAEPFVGRESELKRLIQILSRRTKNNPVLVGAPGIGKTAIVEGLAYKIAKGDVPRHLLKKRLLSLDIAAMVAGTKYRGEFEERMKRMMKEIKDDASVILFIDELHTIIGAGGPEGTLDASNMLKPALSRGEIQIIGVTTTKEYSKYIEKDSALERRFQKIKIEEPSEEDTVKILSGLKSKYEDYHSVSFDESVLPSIVKFSKRYIPERFLPDKAIDILDEAGAAKRIQEDSKPSELAELEMSIANLIEEKRHLVEEQNYEKAAFVRDKVTELRKKFELYSEYWRNNAEAHRCAVSEKDICSVIGEITGIPIEHLDTSETERLVCMEDELNKMVIGQEDAIHIIAGAVRRSRAGVSSFKRPLGSFIFLGPTGVGKTELAKSLAKFLFAKDDSLIRIDMSDYMEKHNASRLIGAPPGYIGYEEGGVLTEAVRNHPYSVVLLDEIEK
ncbi:MAG: ATP-dependent Clp protease ATP-binding subunit, partial [Treponema sp.]|nr:ATP-dependent Clp protease ATP-binding subunit [Treponema sp.]